MNLTVRTPEQPQWDFSGVFIVNFQEISHLRLVTLTSKCWLSWWIIEQNLLWTRALTSPHLHTCTISHLSMTCNFQLRLFLPKVLVAWCCIKIGQLYQKSGYNFDIKRIVHFCRSFFPNIFNPCKCNLQLG